MSFAASTALQLRTIKMLVLRRFRTRHGDSRAGYAWAIVEPMAWVFVLKFGFASHTSMPPVGDSFEVFFTTGVVLARTWRSATAIIINTLHKGRGGTGLPFINRLDAAVAAWVIELLTGAVVIVVILFILQLWGMHAIPDDMLECLVVFAALCVFTFAFASFFYLLIFLMPGLKHFQQLVLMIMFFTSGFATVADRMPPEYRAIIVWNPLVHYIEWFREGFYDGYQCSAIDLEYVFTLTIAFLLIGLMGERAFRQRAGALRR